MVNKWTCRFAVLLLMAAVPWAEAAWLVTTDGTRIETRGSWALEGGLVTFHTAQGTLSSLRARDVDLEASRHASGLEPVGAVVRPLEPLPLTTLSPPAARPGAEEKPPGRGRPVAQKPVLVLTDRDIGPGRTATDANRPASSAERYTLDDLQVVHWERTRLPEIDGFEITGELRNASERSLHSLGLRAELFDRFGARLGTAEAFLQTTALEPGEECGFWMQYGRVTSFDAIRFEPHGAAEPRPSRP